MFEAIFLLLIVASVATLVCFSYILCNKFIKKEQSNMERKIKQEIDLSYLVPKPRFEDMYIFNNRPTAEDIKKAEKELQMIITVLRYPTGVQEGYELYLWLNGFCKGLGADYSSNWSIFFVTELITMEEGINKIKKRLKDLNNSYKWWQPPVGFTSPLATTESGNICNFIKGD